MMNPRYYQLGGLITKMKIFTITRNQVVHQEIVLRVEAETEEEALDVVYEGGADEDVVYCHRKVMESTDRVEEVKDA